VSDNDAHPRGLSGSREPQYLESGRIVMVPFKWEDQNIMTIGARTVIDTMEYVP